MTLAYIPSPTVSEFTIGPITIHIYALCMLAGIIAAVTILTVRWRRMGGTFDQVLDVTLCAVPAGIVGARLYHVVTTPERFFGPNGDWVEIFRIWHGGLGIWGSILFGALGAWAWCRHRRYPMALLADAVAPGLLVAQAIGRLGNWFNQELYGAPTTLPWGLKINSSGSAIGSSEECYDGSTCPTGTLFQPTFLYEMIWNLIGAALLVIIGRKAADRLRAGSIFALYVMWYTAGRTWIETLRIDFAHEFLGVRINVWVSMVVFVLGVVAFIVIQRVGSSAADLRRGLQAVTVAEAAAEGRSHPVGGDTPQQGVPQEDTGGDAVRGDGEKPRGDGESDAESAES
ncbi:prolipoprotein diacylglyceryl transferase [uncultured Bifidobacterium sp.]|uniref:prolipoprotein diacylglyceryl transferase n=1 Tax=uncultured Bifidobacterium sp. TaxID=165187 RepID=UPI0028DD1821|nr:prolipoprotein diacylglyceryl transferase [uncultured Bifidobacterium sp.]